MGRWGKGIYESDSALDFFDKITFRFLREIAYWLSSEQIVHDTFWIRRIITVLELMLLFDKNKIGSTVYLHDQQEAIKRWDTLFFKVWDAEWDDEEDKLNSYAGYSFRKEHRHLVKQLFDRVGAITAYWTDEERKTELDLFPSEIEIPHLSIMNSYLETGEKNKIGPDTLVWDIIHELLQTIIFALSEINDEFSIGFYELDEVWVSLDVIGILCESYQVSIFKQETIDMLENKMKTHLKKDAITPTEDNILYTNVMNLFERLKNIAETYPFRFM